MKTIVHSRAAVLILLGVLLQGVSAALGGGLTVEQVQRDYQMRYHAVTGGYLQWLPCKSSSGSPAPAFPKDGFYGDLSLDPDKGAELVTDLVQKFYADDIIYTGFVYAPNGFDDLENVATIPMFALGEMVIIQPSDVNADNFQQKLQVLEAQIQRLKFIRAQSDVVNQVNGSHDLDAKFAEIEGVYEYDSSSPPNLIFVPTQSAVQNCAVSQLSSASWNEAGDGELNSGGCQKRPSGWCAVGTAVGRWITTYTSSGFDPLARYYLCWAENHRARIHADLSRFRGGTAKTFLKLAAATSNDGAGYGPDTATTYAQDRPTSADENKFGSWSQGQLSVGIDSTTDYITYSDVTPVPILGSDALESVETFGWKLVDRAVIVEPDFTTAEDPQTCCSCTTECKPGGLSTDLNSIHLNIGLGSDNYGGSAGALSLSADLPNPTLATLAGLRFSVASTVWTNFTTPTTRLQFKSSQALADIQVNTAYKYTISIYDSAHMGSIGSDGFYQPVSPASTTIVVENPDASDTIYDRLRITRTDNGNTTVTDYAYAADNTTTPPIGTWTMTTGGGVRNESRMSQWDSLNTIRTETHTIKDNLNNVIYKEVNTYQLFAWGEEMVNQVVDPDGAKLTSKWDYYSDPVNDGGNYRQLKDHTDANGHWTTHQYDSVGRETKEVTQFQNSAFGSADNLNRVISTTYSTSDPEITTVETLQGQEVSRRYEVVHSDEVDEIVCQTVNAPYTAADNLVTITKRYTSGTFQGEPASVQHPDGTMEFYTYVIDSGSGTRTDTVDSGQPNAGKTAIVDGTHTVTVKGNVGQMISRTVTDIASGVTLQRETYSNYDAFNRPQRVTYLDGTHSDTVYGCCGVDTVTDRDGATTQYLYDSLNRQYGYVRNGIMVENIMDAAGQVTTERRTGTDNSVVVTHTAVYDVAGRMSSEVNALNGTTTYVDTFNGSGQRIHTVIYPDTGTRVETYNEDGSLQSVTGPAVFPVRYEYGVEQDGVGGPWRSYTKEIKLYIDDSDSLEWTKAYADLAGRSYKTVLAAASAPYPYSQSFYNNQGQLWKQRDPDGVETVFQYNAKGEQEYMAVDVDHNATTMQPIDFTGNDRISRVVRSVVPAANGKPNLVQVDNYVWKDGNSSSTGSLVSRSQTSTDGLKTWTTVYRDASTPVTSSSQTVYGTSRTVTETAPDNSYTISVYTSGQLQSVTHYDSTGAQIGKTTYTYDAHGRQKTVVDARNGATTFNYNNADLVTTTTTPVPGNGDPAQTTTTLYNTMLQAYNIVNPDNTTVVNEYFLTGALKKTYGSRTYPVEYTYDYAGRMATMKTWQNFAANTGTATTSWNYDPYRGWLANKRYVDNSGPDYTYTSGGRLKTRTWARTGTGGQRIVTTYSYGFDDGVSGNDHGDLVGVVYSNDPQNTPSITHTYDRLGRQSTLNQNGMTETLGYNDANQLLTDSYTGGTLDGLTVTSGFDAYLRRQSLSVSTQPSSLNVTYGYDNASRLQTVSDGNNNSATYTYVVNSPLVSRIEFKQNGTTRMTTTKSYDYLNRLLQIQNSTGAWPFASAGYTYNSANQRVQKAESDGTYWAYGYDSLGQLNSAKKYWPDATFVPGQQFEYVFDDIGNRTSSKNGGDNAGANLRVANYTPNSLNQYSSRDVPGYLDILGIALASDSVTMNGQSTYRRGQYFRGELPIANGSAPVWQNVAVAATGEATVSGNRFVAKNPEQFTYDLDGNLTQDGRWNYTWDAENRLVNITSLSTGPAGSKLKLDFTYDCLGRRIQKIVSTWNGSSYVPQSTAKFVYDGWNLIAELGQDNALIRSYVWGNDLSGSMQGPGGVGGLLTMSYYGTTTTNCFVGYDGNGNVAGLVNAMDGNSVAQYEYGPFGELTRATGPLAKVNPFRFSTKYQDDESDYLYYGYRFYNSISGRWLNRDLIQEAGGLSLFSFAGNNPISYLDFLGLADDFRWVLHWHHDAPVEIFEGTETSPAYISTRGITLATGVDINVKERGLMLRAGDHVYNAEAGTRWEGSIHTKKFNNAWKEWVDGLPKGTVITDEMLDKAIKDIYSNPEFAVFQPKGVKATISYQEWQARYRVAESGAKAKIRSSIGRGTLECAGWVVFAFQVNSTISDLNRQVAAANNSNPWVGFDDEGGLFAVGKNKVNDWSFLGYDHYKVTGYFVVSMTGPHKGESFDIPQQIFDEVENQLKALGQTLNGPW